MKKFRVYEAFSNAGGGVESVGCGWKMIEAETAEKAATEFWGSGWDGADETTVIVATDDDGDSYHYYPYL